MNDDKFCCVENYSVLIPYKDLEKLVKMAEMAEKSIREVKRVEDRLTAMNERFLEVWEKLREIEKTI